MLLQWQLGSVGGVERDHRGGAAGTAVRSLSALDLQVLTTQHSGRRWEALGPSASPWSRVPGTLDPGVLRLLLPSPQSQAIPLRGLSPHFIRRITQASVHII